MAYASTTDYQSGGSFPVGTNTTLNDAAALGIPTRLAITPVVVQKGTNDPAFRKVLQQHGEDPNFKYKAIGDLLSSLATEDEGTIRSVQNTLLAGHFFATSYYGKRPPQVADGIADGPTLAAYEKALKQAALSGTDLKSFLDQRASQGIAAGNPSDVTLLGSGGVADVRLTGEDTLRVAAQNAFVSALDRMPTESEMRKFIGSFHGQQTAAQTAAVRASVDSSVPTTGQFANDVLAQLGMPATAENVKAINAWAQAEGGSSHNNPLNTTLAMPGAADFNKVGVKTYSSYDQGVQATARTLALPAYAGIRSAFAAGDDAGKVATAIASSPWGTGSLVSQVLGQNAGAPQVTGQPSAGVNTVASIEPGSASDAAQMFAQQTDPVAYKGMRMIKAAQLVRQAIADKAQALQGMES